MLVSHEYSFTRKNQTAPLVYRCFLSTLNKYLEKCLIYWMIKNKPINNKLINPLWFYYSIYTHLKSFKVAKSKNALLQQSMYKGLTCINLSAHWIDLKKNISLCKNIYCTLLRFSQNGIFKTNAFNYLISLTTKLRCNLNKYPITILLHTIIVLSNIPMS